MEVEINCSSRLFPENQTINSEKYCVQQNKLRECISDAYFLFVPILTSQKIYLHISLHNSIIKKLFLTSKKLQFCQRGHSFFFFF